ncbi:hypothetical protein EI94DRAFT_1730897, partial [Lactarius quietus]
SDFSILTLQSQWILKQARRSVSRSCKHSFAVLVGSIHSLFSAKARKPKLCQGEPL